MPLREGSSPFSALVPLPMSVGPWLAGPISLPPSISFPNVDDVSVRPLLLRREMLTAAKTYFAEAETYDLLCSHPDSDQHDCSLHVIQWRQVTPLI